MQSAKRRPESAATVDPLAQIVSLLEPGASFTKMIGAAGRWRVRRSEYGRPFYCAVLEGSCRLAVDGTDPIILTPGDFVLIPSADGFTMSSLGPRGAEAAPVEVTDGEFRLGSHVGPAEFRALVGYCAFGSSDSPLLISLLPRVVLVRGDPRLATLVRLVGDESRSQRPARDVVLARLLEVLLIEALRSPAEISGSSSLVRGLSDERLAVAIRRMHEDPEHPWTVARLAKESALSRSAFFERFARAVGITPMAYLLAWRMALAMTLLREREHSVTDVAERVGYRSASTFSVAFSRYVGMPPTRYARGIASQLTGALRSRSRDASSVVPPAAATASAAKTR